MSCGRAPFIFASYLKTLETLYPRTAKTWDFAARISPTLVSMTQVPLPRTLIAEATNIVKAFSALRDLPERKAVLGALPPPIQDPGNYSALMSYDFHVDANGHLRLIEINTNASLSLLVDALHQAQRLENQFCADFRKEIMATFQNEMKLARPDGPRRHVAIVDEKPLEQRMFIEFAMYEELFENEGFTCAFADPSEVRMIGEQLQLINSGAALDLVYNRHTDFYLESYESAQLKLAMEKKATCFSPHPYEYRLLADKARLLELSAPGAIDSLPLSAEMKATIARTLIPTRDVASFNPEELWSERKKWFFKPQRSHGGKAVYRGSSVARSAFAHILAGHYVAQEIVPPPTIQIGEGADHEFKYDLRFYVYRDRIQLACARLYRGQMTNSQTPGGGTALIRWI